MADQNDGEGERGRAGASVTPAAEQNSIGRVEGRRFGSTDSATAAADAERATLEAIERRFPREGREYRFPDGAAAFSDRGESLISQSENPMVVRALVDIAVARQWQSLAVSGTNQFRQAVWNQAMERGIDVKGYSPEASEKARMQGAALRSEASGL